MDQGLQQHPLGREAAADRQCRGTERGDAEGQRGDRHPARQATEPVEVALAGGVQHRAGAQEQHRLEGGVADGEQHRRHQGQLGQLAVSPPVRSSIATATAVSASPTFSVVE